VAATIHSTSGSSGSVSMARFAKVTASSTSTSETADSGGSRPRIRDDVAQHSDLMSLGVPR
jgi:hypothetical protein